MAPFQYGFQGSQVGLGVVAVIEERLLPAVSTLRYVMEQTENYESCQPRHAAKLPHFSDLINN